MYSHTYTFRNLQALFKKKLERIDELPKRQVGKIFRRRKSKEKTDQTEDVMNKVKWPKKQNKTKSFWSL